MLLTESSEIPKGEDWLYEVKYDGYRCLLQWENEPKLISRNGQLLNKNFPELIDFCLSIKKQIEPFLPLTFDGEIVYLTNNFQSDFSVVQTRGRLRSESSIEKHAQMSPCHYVVFDLLNHSNEPLENRKEQLRELFLQLDLPLSVQAVKNVRLQAIDVYSQSSLLWGKVQAANGEGIIAKLKTSKWESDTRSKQWLKIKNWRYVTVILTTYDERNDFFNGSVYCEQQLCEVVTFRHGFTTEQFDTVVALFKANGQRKKDGKWQIPPSICVDIACIDFHGGKLREPRFHMFQLDVSPESCTWGTMERALLPIPNSITVTHPDKLAWSALNISKDDYLYYLQVVSEHMLPFLQDRLLTIIRYPDGVPGESFYQKSSPKKLPEFVFTKVVDDTNHILCNNIETLLWLGNQLAIEFHIPFQTIHTEKPSEIVFDLDPPSVNEFSLAIKAALNMKAIFEQFNLQSFVKTSGGKGMQVYIPLPINTFSYEETGVFTKFVCDFLVEQFPSSFTSERLKKNRGNKLYLDYVQHREGKTIIAPYSTRGNEQALVATPLNWAEVNESLRPEMFSMERVIERVKKYGNPFKNFRQHAEENGVNFEKILRDLRH